MHGHFYQPPRENPWLGTVEQEDSAYPFHDWNERITAECYAPNTAARVLDVDGRIRQVVNNFGRISFNVGPTLLAWMETAAPDAYAGILEADARGASRFGGHGPALAQVYNHVIMPLADERDRVTQVRWGIADFRHRFGRAPEGMWLAETAADTDTLETLAAEGIAFTILSPFQAAATRAGADEEWTDVTGGRVDPTRAYRVALPSGASIAVFFYDGPISRAVAFEHLLDSGARFAGRLEDGFADREGPQLVSIATDGESYGHHHRLGEMALADALQRLEEDPGVTVTTYAEYLDRFPPTHEARIVESSSWSCIHGVERWRSNCGCGGGPDSTQAWRAPLRRALDDLRDELRAEWEPAASELLSDPWAARDAYVEVMLDRSRTGEFLGEHGARPLTGGDRARAIQLLELQHQAQLMYTSCGWFFDELSRIEPMQVLRYAARALQLAGMALGPDPSRRERFLTTLEKAPSNLARFGDGRRIFEVLVAPQVVGLNDVAAHLAISGLFGGFREDREVGVFGVSDLDVDVEEAGRARLATGRMTVRSGVTLNERRIEFGVLHLGDHNLSCGVREAGTDADFAAAVAAVRDPFLVGDVPATLRAIEDQFSGSPATLRNLFRDEQRAVLDEVLATTVAEAEAAHRAVYASGAPLMRFLGDLDIVVPGPLRDAAQVVVNAELREALAAPEVDPASVRGLVAEAERLGLELDARGLARVATVTIEQRARRVRQGLATPDAFARFDPAHAETLGRIHRLVDVVEVVPFEVDLAPGQDVLWQVLRDHLPHLRERAADGDEHARRWVDEVERLAESLAMVVPDG